jgi:uncharacterized protein
MIDHIDGFVDELRAVGLPISLSDKVDALRALQLVDLLDRAHVETALLTTLVKRSDHLGAFHAVFDIYFAHARQAQPAAGAPAESDVDREPGAATAGPTEPAPADPGLAGSSGVMAAMTDAELIALVRRAVEGHDAVLLRLVARQAVDRFGGFEPGRPVGGTYYVMRTLRRLDLTDLESTLREQTAGRLARAEVDVLGARLQNDQYAADLDALRKEVEAEVRRLVASDRGSELLAKTLRKPLPEDIDFVNASGDELDQMRHIIGPLARRLAARLSRRRRRGHHGTLDFRGTIRRSMAYGGVPAELRFHPPRPAKPELVVVADISGSVASFARFTLQLLTTLSSQFSKVRCFVFVDGLAEVTDLVAEATDLGDLVSKVNEQTSMLWVDGHSDYGHALRTLVDRWGRELSHRSSVIILGDARNNYHASQADALGELSGRVRHIFWLNPEPSTGWDTGDSIVAAYAPYCDEVRECRTLGQLQDFVEALA